MTLPLSKTSPSNDFVEVIDEYLYQLLSDPETEPSTIKSAPIVVNQFRDYVVSQGWSLATFDRSEIKAYRGHLAVEKQYAVSTIRHRLGYVKRVYNYALEEGYTDREIKWKKGKKSLIPALPKDLHQPILTEEQVNTLASACRSERDKLIVRVLSETGLRRFELAALQWRDLQGKKLKVRHGKGAKKRVVFVLQATADRLLSLKTNYPWKETDPIFIGQVAEFERDENGKIKRHPDGRGMVISAHPPLTPEGLSQVFDRLSKKAKLVARPHMLRRYATLNWRRKGIALENRQKLLGHSSTAITLHYEASFDDDDLELAFDEAMES